MSPEVKPAPAMDQSELREALTALDEAVLAKMRAHLSLREILTELCVQIERICPGLLCSVLLLDADGKTLHSAAAPSISPKYSEAVEGVEVGPRAGSCGTALYRKQQVIVTDISADPLWSDWRPLALAHGLRACWSTPVASRGGKMLGTFAVYYREPRAPDHKHLQMIAHATHLAAIVIDHDRTQSELRAAEDRYRRLVERLPAIVYIAELGTTGPWHYVSPQIESILGYPPAEWLADPGNWMSKIHPEDRHIAVAAEKRFQETHELFHAEYRMYSKDGRILWFRDEGVLLRETDGRILMQGVLYDITERKRLEDQLRQSQKMEAIGQLAGGIAHDFNNLLMLIEAHNERSREQTAPGHPALQNAAEISKAVTRAATLVRQLLAFSRKQVVKARILDLNATVAEVGKMLAPLLGSTIELDLGLEPALQGIKADASQMEQVVMNLAVNARDAMPQGGKLIIRTRNAYMNSSEVPEGVTPGSYVVLDVIDSGIGMDADTQAHIFEPFFTTKDPGKGTGLGLATVYGIVKQSGGWIAVQSQVGLGTEFHVYLPQVRKQKQTVAGPRKAAASAAQGTETILLVEDQDGIRDLFFTYLKQRGYNVLCAGDGDEALALARDGLHTIDLLLSDINMPRLCGPDLALRLKETRPAMKVLFMSGYTEHPAHSGDGKPETATVLQKPFSLDTLARAVRSTLDGSEILLEPHNA